MTRGWALGCIGRAAGAGGARAGRASSRRVLGGLGAGREWGARLGVATSAQQALGLAGTARTCAGRWRAAVARRARRQRAAGSRRAGHAGSRCGVRGLGARVGFALCTRYTRPVFGPVRLDIFPESNFWTLFVNPVHEHCSSRNLSKKNIF